MDGDETRLRILDAARSCFAAHGYAATTNRMIADRAELTAAAVYHHFGKKPDLMIAVHRATEELYRTRILTAVEAADDFVDKLVALVDVIHDTISNDPEQALFYSVARDEARRHPELKEIEEDRTFPQLFAEIVDMGVQAGVLGSDDVLLARGAVATVATGLAMLARDTTVEAHAIASEGAKRLLLGSLLRTPVP
ncbi:MAG: TetR/AcrR family transcriptional regulator [Acidimicrobiia bacterium]|nr:TetR/AcrR family transcriptional regulator [Acidimicrobiia bacterium]